MAVGMIKTLESRIAQMKEFDETFAETVKGVQEQVDALGIDFNVNELSTDKSVRSHIRKRTQKLTGILERFKRDVNKVLVELESVDVE